jgi:hypothetical protein
VKKEDNYGKNKAVVDDGNYGKIRAKIRRK